MSTIHQQLWEKVFADLPAFGALPCGLRQAFVLLGTPQSRHPLAPVVKAQAQALLAENLAYRQGDSLHLAPRFAEVHALATIGLKVVRLSASQPFSPSQFLDEYWRYDSSGLKNRLFRLTQEEWSYEHIGLACAKGICTRAAIDAKDWPWNDVQGIDTALANVHLTALCTIGQDLLRWVEACPIAPTLREVYACLPNRSIAGLILRWTTQNLAIFPGFDADRGEITCGLHPLVYAQRQRAASIQPAAVSGLTMTASVHLFDDAVTVVTAAAAEPIAFRQDGVMKVRDMDRLIARLVPLPEVVTAFMGRKERLGSALRILQAMGFLRTTPYRNTLQTTDAGRAWLNLPAGGRQRHILEWLRPVLVPDGSKVDRSKLNALFSYHLVSSFQLSETAVWPAVAAALRELGTGTWRWNDAVKWWGNHPPKGVPIGPRFEQGWQQILEYALRLLALPMGLVAISGTGDQVHITLTDAGRWMVGLSDAWTPPETPVIERPLIVQADHTLIFLAPAPALEADIGRFAERCPGVEGTGGLFRLTKVAAQQAAMGGLDLSQVISVLTAASAKPLPANVVHELTAWFGAIRRACARMALVVDVPDEATAQSICATAGPAARHIPPLTVILPKQCDITALARKLRKIGIFLERGRPSSHGQEDDDAD